MALRPIVSGEIKQSQSVCNMLQGDFFEEDGNAPNVFPNYNRNKIVPVLA